MASPAVSMGAPAGVTRSTTSVPVTAAKAGAAGMATARDSAAIAALATMRFSRDFSGGFTARFAQNTRVPERCL
jgi:hypothetical protein